MTNTPSAERRRFSRIPFPATAHIKAYKGELHLNCDVIDISLKGILISLPTGWLGQMHDKYKVDLLLENAQLVIHMYASVAHLDDNSVGFLCEHIDLDSISHLKRLVELNLGDEELLHRELSALINS
ncbi:MAG: PilZ domain-containing protein [Methylophaga sp.]|nr:PilZ domain-containing protein [Methylophaga sp.]